VTFYTYLVLKKGKEYFLVSPWLFSVKTENRVSEAR
jgi:hypothetical protein